MRVLSSVLTIAAIVLTSLVGPPAAPARAQAANCGFVLGFATLANMIPDRVGQCVTNVQYDPVSGDGLQVTTAWHGKGGLMVWRKSDNWTAFTDGYRTWINGPFGLEARLNTQRFAWEQNPDKLPIVPAPVNGERCRTAMLSLRQDNVDAGAGNLVGTFSFVNQSAVSCTFFGFSGAQLLDANNNPLPTKVDWGGGWMQNQPGPSLVTVAPGGTARFLIHWEQVPVGNETACPTARKLAVTPPDEWDPLILPAQITACGGGQLDVSAMQPGS